MTVITSNMNFKQFICLCKPISKKQLKVNNYFEEVLVMEVQ